MARIKAEFFTIDKRTKAKQLAFSWPVPTDLSLDDAKAAARDRAAAAGYRVTAANFRRGTDKGDVAGIVIYMEKKPNV